MIKPNLTYLGFDDRKLVVLSIPILTLIIPFIFYGFSSKAYFEIVHFEFFDSLFYTIIYWIFGRHLIIYLRKIYGTENPIRRLSLQVGTIILTAPIIGVISEKFLSIIYWLTGIKDLFEPTLVQTYSATYFLFFLMMTVYEAVYFFQKYKVAIVEKEQFRQAHIQSQLDNLRNQVNPHFLFNSLNTLMNLIPVDANRAMNYLGKLSKFYRYSVSNQEQSLVFLRTELENVQLYVDLLKERFHDGIQVTLPGEVGGSTQILPLCLQMLIENAVKHNILSQKKPLLINIAVIKSGNYIQVSNNIQQKIQQMPSTGMGLKNIKKRMAFFTKSPLLLNQDADFFNVSIPLIDSNTSG